MATVIITICLMILILRIFGQPISWLVDKLNEVDWKKVSSDAWKKIIKYYKKAGRSATRMVLYFYYVMTEGNLSIGDKALLYGGIIYVIVPHDLLPRRVFKALGLVDDVAVSAWIYNKIKNNITPDIEARVGETLDRWFGYEIKSDVTA